MSALRFFYKVTMGRHDALEMIPLARVPEKLRQVLTPEEVARLIEAAPGRKYRCLFSVAARACVLRKRYRSRSAWAAIR